MIGWCLWRGLLLTLALPAEINRSQLETGGLRIRLRFLFINSNRAEWQELSSLEGFSVSFRIPEGNSKKT